MAEAHATLGVIYLRQGRLEEAERALRAELRAHPATCRRSRTWRSSLDPLQRPEEALPLLRSVLQTKPEHADARYLLGKILLAQGAARRRREHLEAAARLAPEDANIHYQLGRAYQKLGRRSRPSSSSRFRELKAKR